MSVFDELVETPLPKMGGKKKSIKKKLLESIQKEIDQIKDRDTVQKNDGEERFWNIHPTQSDKVVLYVKLRKIIYKFGGSVKKYWIVDAKIKSVVEKLQSIYSEIESMEENHKIFTVTETK